MDAISSIHPVPAAWLRNSSLADHISIYSQHLVDHGYAAHTQRVYLCCVAHFARWMSRRRLAARALCDDDVRSFLENHLKRCRCPAPVRRCPHEHRAALRHLLTRLRAVGLIVRSNRAETPIAVELSRFDAYLRDAKGLATNTRAQRLRIVQQFLECDARCKSGRVKPLTAKALRYFNSQQLKRWSSASAHVLAGALRSYVRFRAVCGDQVEQLLPTIASPAHWRLASLPETLSPAEIEALLSSFKPGMPSRLRAFAMMRCVVDLGLRACEVVLIELNDIDWRAGTIRVGQSKSRRVDVLPLPHATGSALAKYLRFERPSCASRRLFVRHVAPVERLIGPGVVRRAVREAYSRCNLPHTRVHILRHTLASRLLAGGATLKEVADVLRHRDLDTSLIYAKVDRAHLAAVAQPWPGRRP